MKAIRIFVFLFVAVMLAAPLAASGSQRIVLLESFTNVSCPPCASANPITHQFVEDYGTPLVLNVQYHMSWPSATDPFYLDAMAANDAARAYYGVNAVPDLVTDGLNAPSPGDYAALEATVQPRIVTVSPLEIVVGTAVVSDQITVTADISAVGDIPAGDLVVRIALVEPYVSYVDPPGSNGETEFHCSMRAMLPAFAGTPLTITNGQTVQVSETGTLDPAWTGIYAVVWVQNNADQDVLQAASNLARPDYAMYYGGTKGGDIVELLTMGSFPTTLSNVGGEADIYDLHLEKSTPGDWSTSVCIGTSCYPPFMTDFEVALAAEAQEEVIIDITPLTSMGSGTVTMTATSRTDPSLNWTKTVMVMTAGDDVLLVDDDGGEAWESYYAQAIGADGKSHAVWDASSFGPPNGNQLGHYGTVVWSSGFSPPTVEGVTGLIDYLDAGGSLLLSGQLVGYYTFAGGAPAIGQTFYNDYLGATFNDYLIQKVSVEGIADDCIGGGLAFDLSGGDGADNTDYPEDISAYGDGVLCMEFTNNKGGAGVHLDNGTYKAVYFSFGFESVASQTDREILMSRSLEFLGSEVTSVPGSQVARAFLASVPKASPNPFNPCTSIGFEIGGVAPTDLQVSVFDLRGRLVATVFDGLVNPGPQNITWDGKDAFGKEAASGVYLARVRLPEIGQEESFKMTLAK